MSEVAGAHSTTGAGERERGPPETLVIADPAPAARFTLRGGPAVTEKAGAALRFALPVEPCRTSSGNDVAALWLGPDEWLVLAPGERGSTLHRELEGALADMPHALVDVSHRQVAILVQGRRAAEVLNAGCPLDLHRSAFPEGMCTRTLLGKAEVVLWRTGPDAFRLEVWRSFAPYCLALLDAAAVASQAISRTQSG